jgi:predicted dithiol-disulfide oxidoreductase (DUF899 family)
MRVRRGSLSIERRTDADASLSLSRLPAIERRSVLVFCYRAERRFQASTRLGFNSNFAVGFTKEQQREGEIEYNYEREGPWEGAGEGAVTFAAMSGTDPATYLCERPGLSAFALEGGVVYHTYSTYARGVDGLWGMYQWLDRAPKGRNETGVWWQRHDEYDKR